MNIVEHYMPESEDKNDGIYWNFIVPGVVIWSVITFVIFSTIVSDQNAQKIGPFHPEYELVSSNSCINN